MEFINKPLSPSFDIHNPFFFHNRSDINQYTSVPRERWIYKEPQRVDSSLKILDFPRRKNKDYVKIHSEGFQNKQNFDFFTHLYRLFLKNHFFLKRNMKEAERIINKKSMGVVVPVIPKTSEEIAYIPLQLKEFLINHSSDDTRLYKNVIRLYKDTLKLTKDRKESEDEVNSQKEEGLSTHEADDGFIKETMRRISKDGIQTVSKERIKKFSSKKFFHLNS